MQFYKNLLQSTPKIIGVAANYPSPKWPKSPPQPIVFQKANSSITNSPKIKIWPDSKIWHEIEVAVIIGKDVQSRSIKDDNFKNWKDFIGGYCLILDLSDSDWAQKQQQDKLPWFFGKGQDSFLPTGKFIPPSKITDPQNLSLELKINGKTVQNGNTSEMFFKIPQLIKFITDQNVTLYQGDMILTGTPKGNTLIKIGDILQCKLNEGNTVLDDVTFTIAEKLQK